MEKVVQPEVTKAQISTEDNITTFNKSLDRTVQNLTDLTNKFSKYTDEIGILRQAVNEIKTANITNEERSRLAFKNGFWKDPNDASMFVKWMGAMSSKAPENTLILKEISAQMSKKTLNETTDSDGAVLVPTQFVDNLVQLMNVYGLVRKYASVFTMTSKTMEMPALDTMPTVYWPGEGAAITISNPTFDRLTFTAKKLACLITGSEELNMDSSIGLANLFATIVTTRMAQEEDRVALTGYVLNGDPFDGILYASGVQTYTMGTGMTAFDDIDADDLLQVTTKVEDAAILGAMFISHRDVLAVIEQLKASTAGNYLIWNPGTMVNAPTIWGYPYNTANCMPSVAGTVGSTPSNRPFVIFGNLQYFGIGDRETMQVTNSKEYLFAEAGEAWRFIRRVALKVMLPSAFGVIYTATI